MDLVAGLHWLRENLPAFNGNPNMVTLMGHGHGAALANILIVSPVASGMYLLFLHDICWVDMKQFFFVALLGFCCGCCYGFVQSAMASEAENI